MFRYYNFNIIVTSPRVSELIYFYMPITHATIIENKQEHPSIWIKCHLVAMAKTTILIPYFPCEVISTLLRMNHWYTCLLYTLCHVTGFPCYSTTIPGFRLVRGVPGIFLQICIYSSRSSDAIWRHRSESTLAQVMACCLTAPTHYLNHCWLIISKAFIWGQFRKRYLSHHSLKLTWKLPT